MRGTVKETFDGSGVWRLRAYAGQKIGSDGKSRPIQVRETVHGSRRDADKAMVALQAKVDATRATSTDTVGALLDKWLAQCEARNYSPNTLRTYRRVIEKDIRPALGKIKLRNLTAEHLDVFYNDLRSKGLAPNTVAQVHALISGALSQAVKWRLLGTNEAKHATLEKIKATDLVVPTREEVQELVRVADDLNVTLGTLVYVAAHTGMRRGELAALRWADIDLDGAVIHVEHSIYEGGKHYGGAGIKDTKSGKARDVLLGNGCVNRLRQHRERQQAEAEEMGEKVFRDKNCFVFSSDPWGGHPYSLGVISKFCTKVGKLSGVPIHTHTLRHFAATEALGAYDIATVAHRLGHADPAITARIYSHATNERARGLADFLDLDTGTAALPAG